MCETQAPHTEFIDELLNILVLMNLPKTKYGVRSILKYASDVHKVLRLECPVTIKGTRIYQDCSTLICNVLSLITLEFETLQMIKSIPVQGAGS